MNVQAHRATKILELRGAIGLEVSAVDLVRDLEAARGAPVLLRIDSGGGDIDTAVAVSEALLAYPGETRAYVIRAFSAAAVIALHCAHRTMAADGLLMMHKARCASVGTANDHSRIAADLVDKDRYLERKVSAAAGLPESLFSEIDSQVLDARQCMELGIAHELGPASNRTPWPCREVTPGISAREALELLDRSRQRFDTSKAEARAAELKLAEAQSPSYAALIEQSRRPSEIDDNIPLEELESMLDGLNEVNRRRREVLDRAVLQAELCARAFEERIQSPYAEPLSWSCGACGIRNFHPPGEGSVPTPCFSCGEAIPKNQGDLK